MAVAQETAPQATAEQLVASNPELSVWVSASAGTGKTHVLTDRLLRLLLAGARPERILCLTFTRAAAAEMSNRLHERLGGWAAMDDGQLAAAIAALAGPVAGDLDLNLARRLFARVLEAPGGLKVQTLHAFCESLLRRFPIEAGIAPHFELTDERGAAELLESCLERVLARDSARQEPLLARIIALVEETRFRELMAGLLGERARILRLLQQFGGIEGLEAALPAAFGLADGENEESVSAEICAVDDQRAEQLKRVGQALLEGGKQDIEKGEKILAWLAAPGERAALFDSYLSAFFTGGGAGTPFANAASKKTLTALPEAEEILRREGELLVGMRDKLRAARNAAATAVLLRLAAELIGEYEAAKRRGAQLDYDDLILGARDLLLTGDAAPWVLYKLDGGLDHILIDEAQDTNPEQWQVVQALAEEFYAGLGARETPRSLFAVGDTKQSIYSFQRAAPEAFEEMRRHFEACAGQAGQLWRNVELALSYRSTPAVLHAVDAVFEGPAARRGVIFDDTPIRHLAYRSEDGGLVEVWPTEQHAPAPEEEESWAPPLAQQSEDETAPRLAERIAGQIGRWLADGEVLEAYGRPLSPGDILILVQKRAPFVEVMVRELKRRGIAVAGVDRMVLTDQLAVMDLIALGRFLLLPDDDLTLATVLKSPLAGLDDDDLFDLAHERQGSLWQELQQRRGGNARYEFAAGVLAPLLQVTDFVRPFELFGELLGAGGGRRRILARLGADANDPLDEFLALALAYERDHAPSLQGFLAWLEAAETEVKRDQEQRRDEVRVMTVHGAKGLQAPVVFLADTCRSSGRSSSMFWGGASAATLPLWRPLKEMEDSVVAEASASARARQEEEYRRLLYVALTRAQDRLYITGFEGRNKRPVDCWYDLVLDAVSMASGAEEFDFAGDPERKGWRLRSAQLAPVAAAEQSEKTVAAVAAPAWLAEPAPAETSPSRPLSPSRPAEDEQPAQSPLSVDDGARFLRGNLIHRLLQSLPGLAVAERGPAAARYLAQPAHGLNPESQVEIAREVLDILENPQFSAIFGPGSQAEVSVSGRVGEQLIAGQVDRLAVTDSSVMIVDYKTNRPPPETVTDTQVLYLRQMAAYRALLAQIYPGKTITCALLWTHGTRLMALPDELLAAYAP